MTQLLLQVEAGRRYLVVDDNQLLRHIGEMGATSNDIERRAADETLLDFPALPSFRLHRLTRLIEREAEAEYLRLFGLRLVECRILGLAGASGGTTLKQLAEELELDKAHASRLVARMVARGLVARAANPADARSASLRPTAQGRKVRADIHAAARIRNDTLLAVLPAAEAAAFLAQLDRLTAGMRGLLRPAPETPHATRPGADIAPIPGALPDAVRLDRALAQSLHQALTAALEDPQR